MGLLLDLALGAAPPRFAWLKFALGQAPFLSVALAPDECDIPAPWLITPQQAASRLNDRGFDMILFDRAHENSMDDRVSLLPATSIGGCELSTMTDSRTR